LNLIAFVGSQHTKQATISDDGADPTGQPFERLHDGQHCCRYCCC